MKPKNHKNIPQKRPLSTGSFAAAAVLAAIVIGLSQPSAPAPAPGPTTATLSKPTQFPLIIGGKQAGMATLPAGTVVKVLQEQGGKHLVAATIGQTWVNDADLVIQAVAPATPVTPVAATTPVATVTPAVTPTAVAGATPTPATPAATVQSTPVPVKPATTQVAKPREVLDHIPENFKFDQSVIIPGQFVYLASKMEKPLSGKLDVSAVVLNSLKYSFPEFPLTQKEIVKLYGTNQKDGNSEVHIGLKNIGYDATGELLEGLEGNKLTTVLNQNDAVNVVGYIAKEGYTVSAEDKKKAAEKGPKTWKNYGKTMLVWDPKSSQKGKSVHLPNGKVAILPDGVYEVDGSNDEIWGAMAFHELTNTDARKISPRPGAKDLSDLKNYTIRKATLNLQQKSLQEYLEEALPSVLTLMGRQGRSIVIANADNWIRIDPQEVPSSTTAFHASYSDKPGKATTCKKLLEEITYTIVENDPRTKSSEALTFQSGLAK